MQPSIKLSVYKFILYDLLVLGESTHIFDTKILEIPKLALVSSECAGNFILHLQHERHFKNVGNILNDDDDDDD